jgi:iron uptake system component EfeO
MPWHSKGTSLFIRRAVRPALRGTGPRLIGVTAAAAALLTACSSASSGSGAAPSPGAESTAPSTSRVANVTVTAASGCQISSTSLPAGPLTFTVANKDATAVSEVELQSGERIVGEKENLPPGFSGSFSVNIDAGRYTLYCPGAQTENTALTVTGSATAATGGSTDALLAAGTRDYAKYITTQVGYLVATTRALDTALKGGDLAAAQATYDKARPFYEKIEPVAESFTIGKNNLDADIDARANDVPPSQWEGFHRIEKGLFADKSLRGLAPYGAGLVANVKKLQHLTTGLTYKPYELANGAQDLLDEVASSKITGEEERYSHIDLLDFQANDEGAEQAFADLSPGLAKIDAGLAQTITAQFRSLDQLVDTYRTSSNPSGFVYYTVLTKTDKRKLAAAVKAVQEPLSEVASKVAKA